VLDWLRGVYSDPRVVGLARGILEAAIFAAALVILDQVNAADSPNWVKEFAPLAVVAWRFVEGYVDKIDPQKTRRG
jgi:hypothetical protein